MTALRITREELLALHPCDPDRKLALFGKRKSLTARQALAAGVSIENVFVGPRPNGHAAQPPHHRFLRHLRRAASRGLESRSSRTSSDNRGVYGFAFLVAPY